MEEHRYAENIILPEAVRKILKKLAQAGFEGYAVGGCVRDRLLGKEPNDWDITTSASPEEVKALFRRTVDTGLQHGTVTVLSGEEQFEVTTFRIDGEYEDGRHPKEVTFTASLEEDLARRDFTINAMAYNEERGLVDCFGGLTDLQAGIIRCVGDAKKRFGEDALRMLRALRFSAQLGYRIEEETFSAIRELAPTIEKVSAERIREELVKLLVSDHPYTLKKAWETGLTKVFLPEFDRAMETPQRHIHHCYDVGEHLLHSLEGVPAEPDLRIAMLLHDIGKSETITVDAEGITHFFGHPEVSARMTEEILRRLKFDNETIRTVTTLVLYHDYGNGMPVTEKGVRKAVSRIGAELFPKYLLVRRADLLAQSDYRRAEKLEALRLWEETFREVTERGDCTSLKSLAVSGRDLMAEGLRPGKHLGEVLQRLLEEVLEEPGRNTRDYLLERAREWETEA
ncbi:MAG: CCA tRNA nucleotidyltransferase [Lachnospiraceae bacterium]|nr:CCA tRNA nucleotidyltransferase [Lachnospiraceae bacterium]